jgi:hypothetical protein
MGAMQQCHTVVALNVETVGKCSLFVWNHLMGKYCLIWKCQCGGEQGELIFTGVQVSPACDPNTLVAT